MVNDGIHEIPTKDIGGSNVLSSAGKSQRFRWRTLTEVPEERGHSGRFDQTIFECENIPMIPMIRFCDLAPQLKVTLPSP